MGFENDPHAFFRNLQDLLECLKKCREERHLMVNIATFPSDSYKEREVKWCVICGKVVVSEDSTTLSRNVPAVSEPVILDELRKFLEEDKKKK